MKIKELLTFAFLLFTSALPLWAGAGTTAGEFLLVGAGAKAESMGEAYVALADDASAIYWNPGALPRATGTQVTFTHNELLSDIRYEYMALSKQTTVGTWGASVGYLHMGDLIGRDTGGARTSDFSAYDMAAGLSYGMAITETLSCGSTVKTIQQSLADEKANTVAVDLGLLYKTPVPGLNAGFTIKELGPGQKFAETTDPLPMTVRAGLGYSLLDRKLTLGLDVSKIQDAGLATSFGADVALSKFMNLRFGYQKDPEKESGVGVSAGAGFAFKAFHLDYAFVPYSDLGDTHRFTLSVKY